MGTKWYKIVRAQVITYTDTKSGIIYTKNIVCFSGSLYREFDYLVDGGRAMLLREGDSVSFVDDKTNGEICLYR